MRHVFVGLFLFTTACLHAQSFSVVANFEGTKNYLPRAMVQGTDGNFYGVGGWFFLSTPGMVFKVTPDGTVSTLYTYCSQPACADGSFPNALILGSDGNFYGTTTSGGSGVDTTSNRLTGNGTVFKITSAGVFTTIYTFKGTDGAFPSGIIQGSDGNFYGTTTEGGVGGGGIVFRLTAGGKLDTLLSFPIQMDGFSTPLYGASPYALLQASDGSFYGLTAGIGGGGSSVFKISPSGLVSFIYTFPELYTSASLIQAADRNFYGALHFDDGLAGLLFELTPGGVRTTLYNFKSQSDGISPLSLLQAADGNFYGTSEMFNTLAQGVLFEYSAAGGFQVLHDFGPTEGGIPFTLLQSRDGSLWGTSFQGGSHGAGDIFRYQFPYHCSNTIPPTITSVTSAGAYGGGYQYFASGSWLEIKGVNLADPNDPRVSSATNPGQWTTADFNGSKAPTSLDGISVSINGEAAYVWYISPTQLNVQAPEDTLIGNVAISVTNCKAATSPFMLPRQALAPGLLAPSSFASGSTQYLAATFASDGAYVLSSTLGASLGVNSRAAKSGDLIIAYGVGFGDVAPSIPAGTIASQSNTLAAPVTISFGSTPATLSYSGLSGGFVGLYEFYVMVPQLASGDYQVQLLQNGITVPQTVYLTVQN
jgi:uncharacterized protein (TIGR03437 family)